MFFEKLFKSPNFSLIAKSQPFVLAVWIRMFVPDACHVTGKPKPFAGQRNANWRACSKIYRTKSKVQRMGRWEHVLGRTGGGAQIVAFRCARVPTHSLIEREGDLASAWNSTTKASGPFSFVSGSTKYWPGTGPGHPGVFPSCITIPTVGAQRRCFEPRISAPRSNWGHALTQGKRCAGRRGSNLEMGLGPRPRCEFLKGFRN